MQAAIACHNSMTWTMTASWISLPAIRKASSGFTEISGWIPAIRLLLLLLQRIPLAELCSLPLLLISMAMQVLSCITTKGATGLLQGIGWASFIYTIILME